MTARAEVTSPPRGFRRLLARELAPREGRATAAARTGLCCAITVLVGMTFQIPLPAYGAYVVLLISKEDQGSAARTAIGGLLAVTLAVATCLLLFSIDAAEPALRLPAMALSTFLAMYTSRILALGPVSFLLGFVLVMVQSLVDDVPNLEVLTHLTLWLWVVVLLPVSISMIASLLIGPSTGAFIERTVLRVLAQMETCLVGGGACHGLAAERAEVLRALGLLAGQSAQARDRQVVTESSLVRLLDALTMLEQFRSDLQPSAVQALAYRVRSLRGRIEDGDAGTPAAPTGLDPTAQSPLVLALDDTLSALAQHLGPATSQPASAARHPFVPDAFSNPEYLRFAAKTTLAVMTVYALYTLLDYPGLRTAITTCFFVSLGTLGESVHKLLLRVGGALVGGVFAALCIIWILPSLTDIGQLAILVAGVGAACAWVALGGEWLAYGGLQVAFAFFLGVLQGYAPATDLTVLRDRVAGILLGNIVITLVFSLVWPESAVTRGRAALAELFHAVANLLRSDAGSAAPARLALATARTHLDKYGVLQEFESHLLSTAHPRLNLERLRPPLDALAAATLVASSPVLRPAGHPHATDVRARWADAAAASVLAGRDLPPAPGPAASTPAAFSGAVQRADQQLQVAIENVRAAEA